MSDNTQGDWFNAPPPGQPPVQPGQQAWAPPAQPAQQAWAPPAQPGQQAWAPPAQPAQQAWAPPAAGQMGEPSGVVDFGAESVEKKRGIGGRVAVVGLSLALLGGGAFAVKSALSEPDGPASADEAASELFTALESEDFVGAIELMAPSEREAYVEPMLEMVQEVGRLTDTEVGDNLFADLPFEIEFEGLEYDITQLGDGVSWLEVTDGTMDITFDGDNMPAWTDEYRDTLDVPTGRETETVDMGDEDMAFALVEQNGSWYWSAGYSIAEGIRTSNGWDLPAFDGTKMADGADSPEAAVEQTIDALLDFDLTEAFTKLDPQEFAVLYDYSEFFLDDASQMYADLENEMTDEGVTFQLDSIDLSNEDIRGRTVVVVDGFAMSASDGYDDVSMEYKDGCMILDLGGEVGNSCDGSGMWEDTFGDSSSDLTASIQEIKTGITVVERDGKWYVSGGPTIFGLYTDLLASLTREDFQEFTDQFGDIESLLSDGFYGDYGIVEEDWQDVDSAIEGDPFDESTAAPIEGEWTYDDEGNLVDSEGNIVEFEEDTGSDESYNDYAELDLAFVNPDFDVWTDAPENSLMVYMYELPTPITVTNLYNDAAWIEVAEYGAPADQALYQSSLVDGYACTIMDPAALGEGAVGYTCDFGIVITYGRWTLAAFDGSPETMAIVTAQLEHLRSIGE